MKLPLILILTTAALFAQAQKSEPGFKPIFDGKTLNGWTLVRGHGPGYAVKDGVIVCPADGGGNLYTEAEYANFILRFEFKLSAGGNNGIGIRSPLTGDAAYQGMEIQVLDHDDAQYKGWLKPAQHHGSIYGVVAAKTGHLKPVGEWNATRIVARGAHVEHWLNGFKLLEYELWSPDWDNKVKASKFSVWPKYGRERTGHIALQGDHQGSLAFRNIRIAPQIPLW